MGEQNGIDETGWYRLCSALLYGLATGNFIALIQLIPSVSTAADWVAVVRPAPPELVRPILGLIGMTTMAASVPLLIGIALHCDLVVRANRCFRKIPLVPVTLVSTLGFVGLSLTFASFRIAYGIVFFAAAMFAFLLVIFLGRRTRPEI